jgi:hypothetical protein
MRFFLVYCLFIGLTISCKNNSSKPGSADTAKKVSGNNTITADSVDYGNEPDCYTNFFTTSVPIDTNNIIIINDEGREQKLPDFINEQELVKEYTNITFKDVDKDAVEELWIRNFTMGAHCCDEWYVFLKQPGGKFRQTAKLSGGNVCVKDSLFSFTFDEAFGYFMSCFACGFNDSAKGFVMMRDIALRFNKGRFEVVPYPKNQEAQLIKNMQILKQEGVGEIENNMDNSVRKEFAMNLAVYYYNHGKNINATKKLFDTYYTFSDAKRVWKEFLDHLKDAKEFSGV